MNHKLKGLFLLLVVVPAIIWLSVYLVGSSRPDQVKKVGLDIPMAEPREGYEIVYPYMYDLPNELTTRTITHYEKATYYYLSQKRQVVYRYDEHRYLELQGENCEGLMWYHDDANNIHTRINIPFFTKTQLPTFHYYNPGKKYIAIPANDMSFVLFSLDQGRTFHIGEVTSYAAVPAEKVERFIGVDDSPLNVTFKDVRKSDPNGFMNTIAIPGNTGYFILKNGNVLFGETVFYDNDKFGTKNQQSFHSLNDIDPSLIQQKNPNFLGMQPFGAYWEIYHKPNYLERVQAARTIQPEPYQGWDKIRCVVGAEK
ncbi:hypothetical protein [Gilliamella sp. CG16]|uniref:T6SS immunity protein Tli3 family protein n=1 Tax=Gilliamella sp. CG16 TaxID=3351503 RepID=UPI003985E265